MLPVMWMRALLLLVLSSGSALAWDVTLGPVCVLRHETPGLAVELTYDPAVPRYTITLTRPEGWPARRIFGLRFEGPRGNLITTDRQRIDGPGLTVEDRGFGNVLDGMQANQRMVAVMGDGALVDIAAVPLDGAAPAVQLFRDCPPQAGA